PFVRHEFLDLQSHIECICLRLWAWSDEADKLLGRLRETCPEAGCGLDLDRRAVAAQFADSYRSAVEYPAERTLCSRIDRDISSQRLTKRLLRKAHDFGVLRQSTSSLCKRTALEWLQCLRHEGSPGRAG